MSLSLEQWRCVGNAVAAANARANLGLIAGGVAFFSLLAAIPGAAALVALVGLVGDAAWVSDAIAALAGVAPDAAIDVIRSEIARLLEARADTLFAGAVFSLSLSLWSALQGTRWMLMALTLVNRRAEPRAFVRRFVAAGMFTLYGLGLGVLAIVLMGVAPLMLESLPAQRAHETFLLMLRWPILGGAAIGFAAILYRWGPHRPTPAWRWVWPGATFAALLWLIASTLLTQGLRLFPAFGATYGSLSSIIILLAWLYVSAFVFLLGGALNAELEFFSEGRQSAPVTADETIAPPTAPSGAPNSDPSAPD